MMLLIFLLLTLFSTIPGSVQQRQRDLRLLHYTGPKDNIIQLLGENGFTYIREIVPNFYQFVSNPKKTKMFSNDSDTFEKLKKMDAKLKSLYWEFPLVRDKRIVPKAQFLIEDTDWPKQWHLHNDTIPSMNVTDVWNDGLSGKGITIAIVDDGIDTGHSDLVSNYDPSTSYDIIKNTTDPSPANGEDSHGTNCAGVAAASKNDKCVIGTAYTASISAIRLLDIDHPATASQEALALTYKLDKIDIYSNSWGPRDDGKGFDQTDALQEVLVAALNEGIAKGRNGKGAIYVWASGNGGDRLDDCNVDGYSNSMYTISVAGLAPDSSPAFYSEECTAILTATYGGDYRQNTIATTQNNDECIDTFQGTSAACPMAAGIIALVLESKNELTWRDIQHLIVETSVSKSEVRGNFYENGARKKVSLTHGFGLMNAAAMVNMSKSWKTLPEQIRCEGSTRNSSLSSSGLTNIVDTNVMDGCFIDHIEHLFVDVRFLSLRREATSIFITSPLGTTSRILRQRKYDTKFSIVQWTFLSVHTWGEKAAGEWKLKLVSEEPENEMTLLSWKLDIYGTVTNPLAGKPNDGQIGGSCSKTIQCVQTDAFCLDEHNLCINCSVGFHVIDGKCIKDGTLSGFCDESIECIYSGQGCNSSSNICVVCNDGHRVISGFCMTDGTQGGYCDAGIECIEMDIGCDPSANVCVNCTRGYSIINNNCIQDGTLGGFCSSNISCNGSNIGCTNDSICVLCNPDHQTVNGICMKVTSKASDGMVILIVVTTTCSVLVVATIVIIIVSKLKSRRIRCVSTGTIHPNGPNTITENCTQNAVSITQ